MNLPEEDPFCPRLRPSSDVAEELIDAEHERRLLRESELESEGREMDSEWPDWPDTED